MTKRLQNKASTINNTSFAEKVVSWFSGEDLQSVNSNSLSVEIRGSSVTVDLASVIGNRALAEQVKAVKN